MFGVLNPHLARSHHHTTTDSVQGVRGDTGTSSNSPAEEERGKEVTLERADENDRLQGVVHAKVQTTVDDDTKNGGHETTVETDHTIASQSLFVNVDETVELTGSAGLGVLSIVGKTSTGVVEGVDEEQRGGTGSLVKCQRHRGEAIRVAYTAGSQVAHHPLHVTIPLLLVREHGLVGVAEGKVEGLSGEVTDDVGGVTSPQRHEALVSNGTPEAVADAGEPTVQPAGLEHLLLQSVVNKHVPRIGVARDLEVLPDSG